ncbi:MAG TPA: hypothetical protein DIC35_05205 [Candidatus Moranbacteria bacterium]|nr:hypothetical protein [Candidatus Moranbacteria bacterium]
MLAGQYNYMKNIAIIGSGIVGRATGVGFLSKGHRVVFYDVQKKVIKKLIDEGYEAHHINDLEASKSNIFFFVVSTPTEKNKINLKHIKSATKTLGKKLKNKKDYFVVVVRSTVLPNTTEKLLLPIIEKESGKKAGLDFGVAMNPEYLREAYAERDFKNPWLITIGSLDQQTRDFMADIYSDFNAPIHHVSILEAETQKYIHNLYNATKIAFFNEMRLVSHYIGLKPEKVFDITAESAEAFWNKKYGLLDRGPFGGVCLPKDTQAFLAWARKNKIKMGVLEGVIFSNEKFKHFWRKNNK